MIKKLSTNKKPAMLPVVRISKVFLVRPLWRHELQRMPCLRYYSVSCRISQKSQTETSNSSSSNNNERHGTFSAKTYLHQTPKISISLDELFEPESKNDGFDSKAAPRAFYSESEKYQSHVVSSNLNRLDKQNSLKSMNFLGNVSIMKDNMTPAEIVDGFVLLSHLHKDQLLTLVKDKRFDIACEYVIEYSHQFSTPQLVDLLVAMTTLQLSRRHPIFMKLEGECLKRMKTWNTNTQLLVSDAWRLIGRSVPYYNDMLLEQMEIKWRDLTKHQLVQLLYIIGEHRSSVPSLMNKLENVMLRHLEDFTVKEIAAICLGFFKSKFSISSSTILQKFGDVVSQNLRQVDQFTLVSILKVYRHSHFQHRKLFEGIAAVVTPKIYKMTAVAAMHIGLTYATLHLLNRPLLDAIAANAVAKIHNCRCKDIAKYLWTFCSLNYQPSNADEFFSTMVKHIHLQLRDFEDHPEHLISSLLSLAYINRYHHDLINYALNPEFQQIIAERCGLEVSRELFVLDSSVGIECPEYSGSRLPKDFIRRLPKKTFGSIHHEMKHRQEIQEVVALLPRVLGSDKYYRCDFILPHFKSLDIEIQFDEQGDLVPKKKVNSINSRDSPRGKRGGLVVPGYALQLNSDLLGELMGQRSRPHKGLRLKARPEGSGPVKLAVLVSSRSHHRYNSTDLLGLQVMKRRQLRRLGYRIVEIPHYEWFEVKENGVEECEKWLRNKIIQASEEPANH